MNLAKAFEAMNECKYLCEKALSHPELYVQLDFPDSWEYCVKLIGRAQTECAGKEKKAMRWLGFVQGVMWATGLADIETLKNMNKPVEGSSVNWGPK
jgi:hypothetical protein